MKLLITTTSPYARKARIVILEKGVACEEEVANPWENAPAVTANNPLRKIPVLLTDEGGAVYDSAVICEYLDSQGESRLLPADFAARMRVKTREARATGAMDALLAVVMAGRIAPDMQSDDWKNWLLAKTDAALDAIEAEAGGMDAAAPDMADITVGSLLGFMDFRMKDRDWRASRPRLAAWWEAISARDSFRRTVPHM